MNSNDFHCSTYLQTRITQDAFEVYMKEFDSRHKSRREHVGKRDLDLKEFVQSYAQKNPWALKTQYSKSVLFPKYDSNKNYSISENFESASNLESNKQELFSNELPNHALKSNGSVEYRTQIEDFAKFNLMQEFSNRKDDKNKEIHLLEQKVMEEAEIELRQGPQLIDEEIFEPEIELKLESQLVDEEEPQQPEVKLKLESQPVDEKEPQQLDIRLQLEQVDERESQQPGIELNLGVIDEKEPQQPDLLKLEQLVNEKQTQQPDIGLNLEQLNEEIPITEASKKPKVIDIEIDNVKQQIFPPIKLSDSTDIVQDNSLLETSSQIANKATKITKQSSFLNVLNQKLALGFPNKLMVSRKTKKQIVPNSLPTLNPTPVPVLPNDTSVITSTETSEQKHPTLLHLTQYRAQRPNRINQPHILRPTSK